MSAWRQEGSLKSEREMDRIEHPETEKSDDELDELIVTLIANNRLSDYVTVRVQTDKDANKINAIPIKKGL